MQINGIWSETDGGCLKTIGCWLTVSEGSFSGEIWLMTVCFRLVTGCGCLLTTSRELKTEGDWFKITGGWLKTDGH